MSICHKNTSHYILLMVRIWDFSERLEKYNLASIHKEDNKQLVNNYRSVSLLCACFKVFEKLIFDTIFEIMIGINLLSTTQSGFKPSNSCVTQLILITHSIFVNPSVELWGVLLVISKTFERVWDQAPQYLIVRLGYQWKNTRLGYQWKMSFNPDQCKQVQEMISWRETFKIIIYPSPYFNNTKVKFTHLQKHLGLAIRRTS